MMRRATVLLALAMGGCGGKEQPKQEGGSQGQPSPAPAAWQWPAAPATAKEATKEERPLPVIEQTSELKALEITFTGWKWEGDHEVVGVVCPGKQPLNRNPYEGPGLAVVFFDKDGVQLVGGHVHHPESVALGTKGEVRVTLPRPHERVARFVLFRKQP